MCIMNDCIYFCCPLGTNLPFSYGKAFGTFKSEYDFSKTILCFLSYGIKCTTLYIKSDYGHYETVIKARGFSLKSEFLEQIFDFKLISEMFKSQTKMTVSLPQVRVSKNMKKMSATQNLQYFRFNNQIVNDRIIVTICETYSLGTKK